jgi:hypothetical protein
MGRDEAKEDRKNDIVPTRLLDLRKMGLMVKVDGGSIGILFEAPRLGLQRPPHDLTKIIQDPT